MGYDPLKNVPLDVPTPESICPLCGKTCCTRIVPNDFRDLEVMCPYCGALGIVIEDLTIRAATIEEVRQIMHGPQGPEIARMQREIRRKVVGRSSG